MKDLLTKYAIYGPKVMINFTIGEIKNKLFYQLILKSYSQLREDFVIDKILGYKKKGFYVDVGAYDPIRFSNTKRFYNRGWSGINIEPSIQNYKKFLLDRKRDVNLNIAIGRKNSKMKFYQFIPDTSSTLSLKEARKNIRLGYKLIKEQKVPVRTLKNILEKYCSKTQIDFLTIDVEGHNIDILKSNSWSKFKPRVICIETAEDFGFFKGKEKSQKIKTKTDKYLLSKSYTKVFENQINSIYKTSSQISLKSNF